MYAYCTGNWFSADATSANTYIISSLRNHAKLCTCIMYIRTVHSCSLMWQPEGCQCSIWEVHTKPVWFEHPYTQTHFTHMREVQSLSGSSILILRLISHIWEVQSLSGSSILILRLISHIWEVHAKPVWFKDPYTQTHFAHMRGTNRSHCSLIYQARPILSLAGSWGRGVGKSELTVRKPHNGNSSVCEPHPCNVNWVRNESGYKAAWTRQPLYPSYAQNESVYKALKNSPK